MKTHLYSITVLSFVTFGVTATQFGIITDSECPMELPVNLTKCNYGPFLVTLLTNAKNIIEDAKKYASLASCSYRQLPCDKPMDCSEILQNNPDAKSGIHMLWPRSRLTTGPINVYCDMEDNGGGWTVLQRRGDFESAPNYFFQNWASYKKGFGDLQKDFWLGNDNIFALSNQKLNMLKFTLADWEGNTTYATYDEFYIDDELRNYTIHVNNYRGTAGDSFSTTDGASFSTRDRDNDRHEQNCAQTYKGGWWYEACHASNLNGLYLKGTHKSYADGVEWREFRGYHYSLKDTVIKIRPKEFQAVKLDITPE